MSGIACFSDNNTGFVSTGFKNRKGLINYFQLWHRLWRSV